MYDEHTGGMRVEICCCVMVTMKWVSSFAPCNSQIGDNTEIMYFVAHTEEEMLQWIDACRHGKLVMDVHVCVCVVYELLLV